MLTGAAKSVQEPRPLEAQLRTQFERKLAPIHPGLFLRHVRCVDNTTGDAFRFHFSPEQLIRWASSPNGVSKLAIPEAMARSILEEEYVEAGWEWQGDLIDWWLGSDITLILKARQLGITWCAAGVALWYGLYRPGSRVLIQSKNEDDAADLVDHIWEMFLSLDERDEGSYLHLRNGVRMQKPAKLATRPHLDIEWIHSDGRVSQINAMASTAGAGHGRTAALVILDEFSRHPYAREAYKAIVPAQGGSVRARGKTAIISTGNGVSQDEDAGNFFHHLWVNSDHYGIETRFIPWDENPDRDESWYEAVARKLPPKDRGEQYPLNPDEAFILTGDQYFDIEALRFYAENAIREPLYKATWEVPKPGVGELRKTEFGSLAVFAPPKKGHTYALGADTATGRGKDFSCFYVVDLQTMELCAEFHEKLDADQYAEQIHYTGKWYGDARVAVEMGGGYGEAVVIPLRDGRDGRPPYAMLYRHRQETTVDRKLHKNWGFPMNTKTRPLVISQLEQAIRDRELPFLTKGLIGECRTFVHMPTNPSPRASDGSNDDRVMAAAIALEMYRQYGKHVDRYRPARRADPDDPLLKKVRVDGRHFQRRYGKQVA